MAAVWDSSPLENVYLKETVRQRTAALFGPSGHKHRNALYRKHTSRGSVICLWLICPFMRGCEMPTSMWTAGLFCCTLGAWDKRKNTLIVFISLALGWTWRKTETLRPSSIHHLSTLLSICPMHPCGRACGDTYSPQGCGAGFSLLVDNMLQTDYPLCSSSLLYILLIQPTY